MAQHIPIKNSELKGLQTVYNNICKRFEKGVSTIQQSLKFQEIYDVNFKESENDLVFVTWKNMNREKETFEIHFNSQKNEITEIYLIK